MMKHNLSDKYTIAWFKLAECVARGERQKALGVYRLLSHSLDDKAYAAQLEGDLLWAFSDDQAVDKYIMAAQLYHEQMRIKQAIGLYAQVQEVAGDTKEIAEQLIALCSQLDDKDGMRMWQEKLLGLLIDAHEIEYACKQLEAWCLEADSFERIRLYQALLYNLCNVCPTRRDVIIPYIHKLLDNAGILNDSKVLNNFLLELEACNSAYADEAKKYLNR